MNVMLVEVKLKAEKVTEIIKCKLCLILKVYIYIYIYIYIYDLRSSDEYRCYTDFSWRYSYYITVIDQKLLWYYTKGIKRNENH